MASWLCEFGLTETEATIYLALLRQGACTAGMLAKFAKQHRRTVYDAVERLLEKGLVGVITRNNRKHYLALNPKTLLEFLEAQQAALEHLTVLVEKTTEQECTVQLFHGRTGLKQALEDQLKERKPIVVLNPCPTPNHALSFYFPKYERVRIAKKLHTTMITTKEHAAAFALLPYSTTEKIPVDLGSCATNISGTLVSFLVWGEPSFSLSIRHATIAQGFREIATLSQAGKHG